MDQLFTSESVSEGHRDKIADQIADAILDGIIAQDVKCRVASQALVKSSIVMLTGEITTTATCTILSAIGKQPPDIASRGRPDSPRKTRCR